MNLIQKAIYIISCDMPSFLIWGIYSQLVYGKFSWTAGIFFILGLLASIIQLAEISKRLERIPIQVDEMVMRGVDFTSIIMTTISYLFILSFLIPKSLVGLRTDIAVVSVSILIQFLISMITDNAPYDIVYLIKGYAYRTIKVDGVEHILLCKKRLRNRKSIHYVVSPFRGFLIHVKY